MADLADRCSHALALQSLNGLCLALTFELADIEKNAREGKKGKPVSPIALEAVRRLDALFEIERTINGRGADDRRAVRMGLLTEDYGN